MWESVRWSVTVVDYFREIHTNTVRTKPESVNGSIKVLLSGIYEHIKDDLRNSSLKYSSERYIPPSVRRSLSNASEAEIKPKPRVRRLVLKSNRVPKAPALPKAEEIKEERKEEKKEHTWLTEEGRQKWREDWRRKISENESFARRMKEIQREILERKKAQHAKLLRRLHADHYVDKPQEVADALEAARARREREKAERAEVRKKERERLLQFVNNSAKRYGEAKPKISMPQLERVKKELADKRNVYTGSKADEESKNEEEVEYDWDNEKRFEEIVMKYSNDRQMFGADYEKLFPEALKGSAPVSTKANAEFNYNQQLF